MTKKFAYVDSFHLPKDFVIKLASEFKKKLPVFISKIDEPDTSDQLTALILKQLCETGAIDSDFKWVE